MSGPKVVRIVTREELAEICRGHLAQLDATIEEWIRVGRRNDCVSESDISGTQNRRKSIAGLLSEDRFTDLQKQVEREVSFLRTDLDRRLNQVAAEAAEARSTIRRQREGAHALLDALNKAGNSVPADLELMLREGSDPAAISAAWSLFSKRDEQQQNDAQQALATKYGEGVKRRSFADWANAQSALNPDPALTILDRKIAELQLIDPESAQTFEIRLSKLESCSDSQRNLQIDSLNLDLSRALTEIRATQRMASDLALILAELAAIDAETAGRVQEKVNSSAPAAAVALLGEAKEALLRARAHQSAELRRNTLLTNLATIGYEVTEGMSTGWVEEGRLVVRHSARPDYGVEIGGNLTNARVQMRVVSFSDGPTAQDSARDQDAETLWCSDVESLKAHLKEDGDEIVIERSLPVGATPVKRVANPTGMSHHQSQEVNPPRAKTLR